MNIGNPSSRLKSPRVTPMRVNKKEKNIRIRNKRVLNTLGAMCVMALDMFGLNVLTIRGSKIRPRMLL
jgi:hypothetical protein